MARDTGGVAKFSETGGRGPRKVRTAVRWFGRLYLGFACVEGAAALLGLFTGHLVFAAQRAAWSIGWGLFGGAIIGASHVELAGYNSPEMVRSRALSAKAFSTSHLRWLFGALLAVQFGAMAFIAYLLLHH
jgi:hypothetical protein